jgi:methionine-S-sulfoxide reductase
MKTQIAIVSAGCFWGVQYYFDQIPGVVNTEVGYTGGHTDNPTYEQVCMHTTGHAEAVRVVFNPEIVSYTMLLKQFFRMHDPTTRNRQGPDIGDEYRSEIFYTTQDQHKEAVEARNEHQQKIGKPVVTKIERATTFYLAEEYHQKFTEKTGMGMCHIPYTPLA